MFISFVRIANSVGLKLGNCKKSNLFKGHTVRKNAKPGLLLYQGRKSVKFCYSTHQDCNVMTIKIESGFLEIIANISNIPHTYCPFRCVKNCGQRLVADKRLVLLAECTAECDREPSSLQYYWDVISSTGSVVEGKVDWKKQTSTDRTSAYLVINADTFKAGDDEIAALRVTGGSVFFIIL